MIKTTPFEMVFIIRDSNDLLIHKQVTLVFLYCDWLKGDECMFKKAICITIIFAMFITLTPYTAAEEAAPVPSIEEILSEYHANSFATQTAAETNVTSSYSQQAVSTSQELTLIKQNTLTALADAGYEAYDVNSKTFDSIEDTLNTDLNAVNLDPNSSYIICYRR